MEPEHDAGKICAVIHAWYPEVLGELLAALDSACAWRLLVTTGAAQKDEVEALLEAAGHDFEILVCENRGRDILPFLTAAARLRDEGHPFLLKLHTKRSPHRDDGEAWRRHLIDGVLPRGHVGEIVRRFTLHERLGILAPSGHLHPLEDHIAGNGHVLDYARRRIGLDADAIRTSSFVPGSMFWIRIKALSPILDAGFMQNEFDAESGQLDGTLAHAIERLFAVCARDSGFEVGMIENRTPETRDFYSQNLKMRGP